MKAGTLRHLITIESYIETQGSSGSPTKQWSEYASTRAGITNNVSKEVIESGKVTGKRAVVFYTRYIPGVTNKMRIVYNSDILEIVDVNNTKELNREYYLTAIDIL